MSIDTKIKASIISAGVELVATHPLDYIKTILQNRHKSEKIDYKKLMKNPYKGASSRLVGIVPMRILFWNSLDYFNNKGFNPINSGIATSIIQTSIDYPIEQIKTKRMIGKSNILEAFKGVNIGLASGTHLIRNIGFAICVNKFIQLDENSMYYAAIGGFTGSLITHPFDSLKTWYQAGNKYYPTHWTVSNYMSGWQYRCSISLIGMNIGWIVFNRLKN